MRDGEQIWTCTVCSEKRQWGNGKPEKVTLYFLMCSYCHCVTAHKFSHVDYDTFQEKPNKHVTRDAAPLPYDRDGFQQKKEAL